MEMLIDHDSILTGVGKLAEIGQSARNVSVEATQNALNHSFSGVSGLDQLGGGHGGVINGGTGSAITVMQSYAEQVEWLSGALAASYQAITGQNAFVARGMDIADEGGVVGEDGVAFPTRPRPRFENFTFLPPVLTPALSLNQLSSDFSATKIGDLIQATRMWRSMSADVGSIATQLGEVVADLGSRNRGDVIEAAIGKVAEVAQAGDTFSLNSGIMASTMEVVNLVQQEGALTVAFAMPAIMAIPDPVARAAAEQAFLLSFPASYTPAVLSGMPPIRNLMVMDPAPDGGGEVALGMGTVEGTGSKHNASGLRAPGAALDALTSLQRSVGAGDFGTVQAGATGPVGAMSPLVQAGDVGTTAASTGALTAPPSIGSMGASGLPGTGAGGAGGAGLPGSLPAVGPMALGRAGGTGLPGTLNPLGAGGHRGTPTALGQSAITTSAAGRPAFGAGGGIGAGAMGGAVGGRPIVGGGGHPGLTGGAGARTPGAAVPGAVPTAGIPAAGVAGGTNGASRSNGGGRGMMPMMGAPMAGQQQAKGSKVKTVTSAVEEDANVAALLGERPPVVPGVIGAWARG